MTFSDRAGRYTGSVLSQRRGPTRCSRGRLRAADARAQTPRTPNPSRPTAAGAVPRPRGRCGHVGDLANAEFGGPRGAEKEEDLTEIVTLVESGNREVQERAAAALCSQVAGRRGTGRERNRVHPACRLAFLAYRDDSAVVASAKAPEDEPAACQRGIGIDDRRHTLIAWRARLQRVSPSRPAEAAVPASRTGCVRGRQSLH
jgi:hypothetical protein